MDIWAWVHDKQDQLREAGHDRLADIMEELPGLVVDNEVEQVESVVPEGVALARSLNEKWIELFIRHWYLQSLVLTRMEVKDALKEAISLLDFAHQDDTKDCPQSVCVVQDLACCYAHQDGPGFAEQRKAVAQEAFERIDAKWSCFVCIAQEYSDALVDEEKFEEVVNFLEECDIKLQKAGEGRDTGYLLVTRIRALIALGRLEEAEKLSKKLSNPYGGESFELSKKICQALVQAHLGNIKKTLRLLPDRLDRKQQANFMDWVEIQYIISLKSQEYNTVKLAIQINKMIQQLFNQGVYRDSLNMSFTACRLAIQRKQFITAQVLINACPAIIKRLHQDMGAQTQLNDLKTQLGKQRQSQPDLPDNADEFIRSLEQTDTHLEFNLARLTAAHKKWPENQDIIILMATNLESLGFSNQARDLLLDYLGHNPNAPRVLNAYGGHLIDDRPGEFPAFIQQYENATQNRECLQNIQWLMARYHRKIGNLQQAKQHLQYLLDNDPELFNTRLFLSSILRDLGEYATALEHLEILLQNEGEEDLHWDRMVLATFLKDWDKVRESCAAAGVKIKGSGPINENWGACRIQIKKDNEKVVYYAIRTGPVTARIEGISRIDEDQHYGDELIFDPYPLNQLNITDEDGDSVDEEGYDTYIYPCIEIINKAGYNTFDIDGVHPGEDRVEELRKLLNQAGAVFSLRSTDAYELYDEQEDKEYPGFYAYFLVKPDADLNNINELLKEFREQLPKPLVWTGLLHHLEDTDELTKQQEDRDRFELD